MASHAPEIRSASRLPILGARCACHVAEDAWLTPSIPHTGPPVCKKGASWRPQFERRFRRSAYGGQRGRSARPPCKEGNTDAPGLTSLSRSSLGCADLGIRLASRPLPWFGV